LFIIFHALWFLKLQGLKPVVLLYRALRFKDCLMMQNYINTIPAQSQKEVGITIPKNDEIRQNPY